MFIHKCVGGAKKAITQQQMNFFTLYTNQKQKLCTGREKKILQVLNKKLIFLGDQITSGQR